MTLFYTNEGTVYSANSRCCSTILVFSAFCMFDINLLPRSNLPTGLVCLSSHCPGAKKETGELSPFLPSEVLKLHLLGFLQCKYVSVHSQMCKVFSPAITPYP